ncbi:MULTISPECIES: class I SAM-dependent methyltransferase [Nostocales]|uniref:Methyltransferase n=3 Tax=Nostocales TaxID=1161 RepID=A0A0C1QRP6_9CYAN|nr:class I SAM-dependent methyltransferase [Tolypothrix bouteillei]KAF3891172.1 class I SAM-dependent methyltransferase [Tolypothrix bouteillei VB521301]
MNRVLEPEVMDDLEESMEYDAMNFLEVNTAFAREAIALGPSEQAVVLDAGTGPGRIPVLMCQIRPQWRIIAVDLAQTMLQIASQHVQQALLQQQISLELVDVKNLPYAEGQFDMVISNSLVHHLSDPLPFFKELQRVLKPNGGIFIRDLVRPDDEITINTLVETVGPEYDIHQKKLFRDSLYAALTVEEVNQLVLQAGLEGVKVYQSSDCHWTIERQYRN